MKIDRPGMRMHGIGMSGGPFWVGVVFLTLGVLWTLDNLGFMDSDRIIRWWPAVLIAFGLARLTGIGGPQRLMWGAMLTVAGSLLLANQFGYVEFGIEELWAIGLIFIGGMIVYRSVVSRRPGGPVGQVDVANRLTATAIMAGVERKVQSPAFRGGDATAIMGAVELDFRATRIDGEEAVLDLLVIMGGVDLYVPADWQVVHDVVPVMGAIEDTRKAPAAEARQRLRLRGFVMMAGVEIKDIKES